MRGTMKYKIHIKNPHKLENIKDNQNVMCTQYVIKHNLVLDGMLIY